MNTLYAIRDKKTGKFVHSTGEGCINDYGLLEYPEMLREIPNDFHIDHIHYDFMRRGGVEIEFVKVNYTIEPI